MRYYIKKAVYSIYLRESLKRTGDDTETEIYTAVTHEPQRTALETLFVTLSVYFFSSIISRSGNVFKRIMVYEIEIKVKTAETIIFISFVITSSFEKTLRAFITP